MTLRHPHPMGRTRPVRALGVAIPLAVIVLTATACGNSNSGAAASPGPSLSSASSAAGQAQSGSASGSAGGGTKVTATETEFKITLDTTTFHPGSYTFVADDTGGATHALTIDGPGVKDKPTDQVSPGKTAAVTVTLQKGTYELYCPVGNHKQQGMDMHITVS